MADPPAFAAIRHGSLAAAGLGRAGVRGTLAGDTLVLTGRNGERRDVPLASIERLRVGYEENRYAGYLYRMMVWTGAAPRPLTLATIKPDEADFAAIARAIAGVVERHHGAEAIEGGLNWREALVPPLALVILFTLATFAANADPVARGDDSFLTVALFMAAFEVPILGVVLWFFTRPYRPRRVGGASGLERFLPGRPK